MGHRINTVMQPASSPCRSAAPGRGGRGHQDLVEKAFSRRGEEVVARNFAAVDRAWTGSARSRCRRRPPPPPPPPDRVEEAPDFVKRVTARMLEGNGDLLPVSALPVDGGLPDRHGQWEKRSWPPRSPSGTRRSASTAASAPSSAALDHPHEGVRPEALEGAPAASRPRISLPPARDEADHPGRARRLHRLRGLRRGLPGPFQGGGQAQGDQHDPGGSVPGARARALGPPGIPELDRDQMAPDTVKGSQVRQPLFEFSGPAPAAARPSTSS